MEKVLLRHLSASKKKAICRSSIVWFMDKKKNSDWADSMKIKDEKIQIFWLNEVNVCACDIAGCALNNLNLWRIRP